MKERGILFTPENIRSILRKDNPKTQTRRVINPQPTYEENVGFVWKGMAYGAGISDRRGGAERNFRHKCPHGEIGDRLYIKEGVIVHASIPQLCGYYMDGARATEHWEKRLTAIFMPKYAARTWLEITDVRVECLLDIGEKDAKAEGATPIYPEFMYPDEPLSEYHYRRGFQKLWQSINAKKHPWDSNPFCWCISFNRVI